MVNLLQTQPQKIKNNIKLKNEKFIFIYILSILTVLSLLTNFTNIIPNNKFGLIFLIIALFSILYILKISIVGYTLKKLILATFILILNLVILFINYFSFFSDLFESIMSS